MAVSVGELVGYLRLDSSGFDRGISVAQQEMRTAAGMSDKLATAVGVTETRLAGAGRTANELASSSAKLRAAQLSLVAAQERYNTVLNQGDASAGKLASAEAAVVRANERVAASSRQAQAAQMQQATAMVESNKAAASSPGLMMRTAEGFLGAGKAALGMGAAFGTFELAKQAIDITKQASEFQRSMLLINTNANAGTAEVKSMTTAVLGLSGQVATAPTKLADALYHVEQNGLRGQKALEALRAGAEGAKIGLADVEDTTNTMTIAVASGIHGMGNLQKAMGTMIAIAGTGDMRLKDLNEALSGGILSIAKGYGASLQDVAAVLATLGDNGIRGADAATQLRMMLMSLSTPAAKGKKALQDIGLSMTSLRDDMEKHGLVHAMNDLEQHMTAAGVTGAKVGGFLTEAFGKKAGAGLGVLIGEMDRVNTKFAEGKAGADSFAKKWDETTHTASFAFQKIGAEFQAAGIKLADKLIPAATAVAVWLGEKLPAAAKTLENILAPLWQEVAAVAVPAFHGLGAVLGAVSAALGGVGHFLQDHRQIIAVIVPAVLSMWAAYRGYRIAVTAVKAIDLALGNLATKMTRAGGALAGLRGNMSGFSTGAVMGTTALIGIGAVIGGITYKWQQHAKAVAEAKQTTADFVAVLQQTNGAINDQVVALVTQKLAESGAYEAAKKYGISLSDVTQTALGNAAAQKRLFEEATRSGGAVNHVLIQALGLGSGLGEASKQYQLATKQAKDNTTAAKSNAAATSGVADAAVTAARAQDAAAAAAKRLDDSLKALSAPLNTRQALDQFRQAVQGVQAQLDKQNHSLRGTSAAAVTNRLALDQAVQSALAYANALKDEGKTQPQINAALKTQIQYLIDHAKQMHLNKDQVRAYLQELHLTPSQVNTTMLTHTQLAQQKIRELQAKIDAIRQNKVPHLNANSDAAQARIRALQAQINSLQGKDIPINISVSGRGVRGGMHGSVQFAFAHGGTVPGSGSGDTVPAMLTPGEEVIPKGPATKHRDLLKAIAGDHVQKFAKGGTVRSLGNVQYKTSSDYQTALHGANSAISAVLAAAHNINASASDMATAAKDLSNAAHNQRLAAAFQREIALTGQRLTMLAAQRDSLHARLGTPSTSGTTAYDRLDAARQQYSSDYDKYRTAMLGFDVTSLPTQLATTSRRVGSATITTATGGAALSTASIIAADQADVTQALQFNQLMRKLVAEGLNPDDVAAVAAKGPSAMAYAKALAASTPAQIRQLNGLDWHRKNIANDTGKFLAHQFDAAGIASAQGYVNGLLSRLRVVEGAADRLASTVINQMKKRLGIKSPSRVAFDIAAYVGEGAANGLRHKEAHVRRAADRLAGAMVPNPGVPVGDGAGSTAGGVTFVQNVYGQTGQSPAEIGHIAAADVIYHFKR